MSSPALGSNSSRSKNSSNDEYFLASGIFAGVATEGLGSRTRNVTFCKVSGGLEGLGFDELERADEPSVSSSESILNTPFVYGLSEEMPLMAGEVVRWRRDAVPTEWRRDLV